MDNEINNNPQVSVQQTPTLTPTIASPPTVLNSQSSKPQFKKIILLIVVVIILIVFGALGYFYYSFLNKTNSSFLSMLSPKPTPTQTSLDINTWLNYADQKNRYSFKYPSNWQTDGLTFTDSNKLTSELVAFHQKPVPTLDPSRGNETLSALAADSKLLFSRNDATESAIQNPEEFLKNRLGTKYVSSENTSINNLDIIKIHYSKCDVSNFQNECISLNFIKGNSIYSFIFIPAHGDENITNKIIETFQSN